ncbi:MAG: Dickkopf N-terminal cysteine-rich domain-containing protein [Myxococcales bacterium]
MRSALLIALCLACLALSCRMDCGVGSSGVGCETGGTGGVIGCRSDSDCGASQFCDFTVERCPGFDSGTVDVRRIQSSTCRTAPTETLGSACASNGECAPDQACNAGQCGRPDGCGWLSACRSDCVRLRSPHGCDVCVCDC